jgi:Family of unknown function (DUF6220)
VKAFETMYRYWITLIWLAVVVQIAAAAYGAFYAADKLGDQKGSDETKMISEKAFDHGFGFHTAFGYIIFLAAVLLLLIALAGRLGKRRILFSLAVLVVVVVQVVLAWISEAVHAVGPLHGLNALVIFGLTGSMAGFAWRQHRASRVPEASAAPTT